MLHNVAFNQGALLLGALDRHDPHLFDAVRTKQADWWVVWSLFARGL
jgi:hypothetical protein